MFQMIVSFAISRNAGEAVAEPARECQRPQCLERFVGAAQVERYVLDEAPESAEPTAGLTEHGQDRGLDR